MLVRQTLSVMARQSARLIRKRDGRLVSFDDERIIVAIEKAMSATGRRDPALARAMGARVVASIRTRFPEKPPGVEDVQDAVEQVLVENGLADVAKAYIIYRQRRADVRQAKALMGVRDELKLSVNAASVLERRYLRRDEEGHIVETPLQMFKRVAKAISKPDRRYDPNADLLEVEREFLRAMTGLYFLPNSPTLMNAGTRLGQLAACFVIPVEDSIRSIFGAIRDMALIHQSGGGTGFSFSRLRPAGDIVRSTKGIASGPISFMNIFDVATEVVKQGGRRRGANMGILSVDHPDIVEFIGAKEREGVLSNFNLSVAVTDSFMLKVEKDEEYDLINPRTQRCVKSVRARDIFDMMVAMAWKTGDPGVIFTDEINRHNPTPELGRIESTNPCGEVPLLPYESCTLGSLNLSKCLHEDDIDWEFLGQLVRTAVHFLDNVLDSNRYPIAAAAQVSKGNRKIGLGVMGFAELLVRMGIPYDSREALDQADKIMGFIGVEGRRASEELAQTRGAFPNFAKSVWADGRPVRNATVTTIAPTGTISIIAGTSSGIEPLFAVAYLRRVMDTRMVEVNPVFEEMARKEGFYSNELMAKIARVGNLASVPGVPERFRSLFVTAFEISPEHHVAMQAAFQRHVDNAVSKTVNLPHDAGLEDVRKVFQAAHGLGCKGVTVYRTGSRAEQVLYVGQNREIPSADSEYSGGCPKDYCPF